MINLTLDEKIKIGSKVVYIPTTQKFYDDNNNKRYTGIDVTKAVGIVIEICPMFNTYRVEFDDVSFLPPELQYINKWYVKQHAMEAL